MMGFSRVVQKIWFCNDSERKWFRVQYEMFYSRYQRIVALYALKRLSMIFKCTFDELTADRKLLSLWERYKCKYKIRTWLISIFPVPCPSNPLQMVMDDFSCAETDFSCVPAIQRQSEEIKLTSLHDDATVADYVRFIHEYDTLSRNVDRLRVTASLGVTPP